MLIAIMVITFSVGTNVSAREIIKGKLEVHGNCGMCEKRIEEAASSLDGVKFADWDEKSEMIIVKYSPETVNLEDISKAIAEVGHDTEMHEANDKVYKKLPACCKYRE